MTFFLGPQGKKSKTDNDLVHKREEVDDESLHRELVK